MAVVVDTWQFPIFYWNAHSQDFCLRRTKKSTNQCGTHLMTTHQVLRNVRNDRAKGTLSLRNSILPSVNGCRKIQFWGNFFPLHSLNKEEIDIQGLVCHMMTFNYLCFYEKMSFLLTRDFLAFYSRFFFCFPLFCDKSLLASSPSLGQRQMSTATWQGVVYQASKNTEKLLWKNWN